MRISGIVLLVLAVGHVLIMHVLGGGVGRVNFAFVAVRWQSPFWRTWDWAMLVLALIHGINGLRNITQDYVTKPQWRFVHRHVLVRHRVLAVRAGHGGRVHVRPLEVARGSAPMTTSHTYDAVMVGAGGAGCARRSKPRVRSEPP